MPDSFSPTCLDNIRAILSDLPEPDADALATTRARDLELTKPRGSLGRLEAFAEHLAGWQGASPPRMDRPHCIVFAGNHGVAAQGVSAFPAEVTQQMVGNFQTGGAAINQLCRTHGTALDVIPIRLDHPTADFTQGPAMSEADTIDAFTTGMRAVNPKASVLALGEMGIANTTSAAAICLALYGETAEFWTGPGTGVEGAAYQNKIRVVGEGVAANHRQLADGLHVLRCLGGRELAAIAGAIVAARLLYVPVLLDGFICSAAAATLESVRPGALDHCLMAHVSAEPGHRLLVERLKKQPMFDLGMRLGEASGAALAIGVLQAAVNCHADMATFAEAAVSGQA